MTEMAGTVTCRVIDGVADVRLNRPHKLNALDAEMFARLVDLGDALRADRGVRAVVLSGEGRAFCAGMDFGGFQAMAEGDADPALFGGDPDDPGRLPGRTTHQRQQAALTWQEMPVPVIAAIHGVALGGGCQIALGADLRYTTADALLSVLEIRWGLAPDMGATAMLPRLVGLDVAKELTFSGRMVSGAEAVQIGLATRVCDDARADALSFAKEIARSSPSAIRTSKLLLNQFGKLSFDEQLRAERRANRALVGTPDQVEAITAYFERRVPTYPDPA